MAEFSTDSREISNRGTDPATQDALFEVLADEERRTAIEYLATETGAVSVDDLADVVAAKSDADEGPSQRQEQTKTEFYHVHIPEMEAAGLLDYDEDEQLVEPTERVDIARRLIVQAAETSDH